MLTCFIFQVLFSKKSLKKATLQKNVLDFTYMDDIRNLEDSPKVVFIT